MMRSAKLLDLLAALRVGDDDGELVAAHAADMAVGADFVDQPLGDRAEHGVALGVAERVVDRLEAVEVEEQDRARAHCRRSPRAALRRAVGGRGRGWAGPTARPYWRGGSAAPGSGGSR